MTGIMLFFSNMKRDNLVIFVFWKNLMIFEIFNHNNLYINNQEKIHSAINQHAP